MRVFTVFYRKWGSLDLLQFDYLVPNKVEGLVSRLNQSMDLQDKTFTNVFFLSVYVFEGHYASIVLAWNVEKVAMLL